MVRKCLSILLILTLLFAVSVDFSFANIDWGGQEPEETRVEAVGYEGMYDKKPHSIKVYTFDDNVKVTYSTSKDGPYTSEKPTRTSVGKTTVYVKAEAPGYKPGYTSADIVIEKHSLENATVWCSERNLQYNDGKEIKPSVEVYITDEDGLLMEKSLIEGEDYYLEYSNNVNVGEAYCQAVGKGNFYGKSPKIYFTIEHKPVDTDTVVTYEPVLSSGKIRLNFPNNDGMYKYTVKRSTSKNGSYTTLGQVEQEYFVDNSAVAGKTYYYKVYGYGRNTSTSWICGPYCCDLPQPKNIKITTVASSGKPKVTWDKVEGADKYYIYRANTSTGTYTYMYSTTNTSYTNTSAKAGYTYYYKIMAVDADNSYCNSARSNYCYMTCDLPQPKISISSSSGKPMIKWSKIDGASKYEIYRKVGADGTYSKYYTTTYNSFTNTSATSGKTYYYKIKAVSARTSYANSAYSNVVYMTSK